MVAPPNETSPLIPSELIAMTIEAGVVIKGVIKVKVGFWRQFGDLVVANKI